MSKLHKLLSAAVFAVAIAVFVVLALKPATVEAAGGKQCWWSLQDHNRVERGQCYGTQALAQTYCGSGPSEVMIMWIEKVGTTKNICRY
jgi:hypothetical protein